MGLWAGGWFRSGRYGKRTEGVLCMQCLLRWCECLYAVCMCVCVCVRQKCEGVLCENYGPSDDTIRAVVGRRPRRYPGQFPPPGSSKTAAKTAGGWNVHTAAQKRNKRRDGIGELSDEGDRGPDQEGEGRAALTARVLAIRKGKGIIIHLSLHHCLLNT